MKLKAFIILDVKIFNLMRYDSYSRFLKSQLYKDCIVNEMEGKPLLYGNSNEKQIKKNQKFHCTIYNQSDSKKDSPVEKSKFVENFNSIFSENNVQESLSTNILFSEKMSLNNLENTNSNQFSFESSTLNNINNKGTVSSFSSNDSQSLNKKEKKRSTILPWTKGN